MHSENGHLPAPGTGIGRLLPAGVPTRYGHSAPTARREGDDFLVSPATLLRTLLRWWRVALPAGAALAVLSCGAVWYWFVPQYRAAAWIQIQDQNPYLVTEAYEEPEKAELFVETQLELLVGPLVLEPVLLRPTISALPELQNLKNPVDALARRLRVEQVGKSEMYKLSYAGPDADNAARIVNAVLDEYFALRDAQQADRADRMIALLDQEKERRATVVRDLRDKMREFSQDALGLPMSELAGQGLTHPLHALQERLTATEVERRMLEIQAQALQESILQQEIAVPDYMVEIAVDETTEIQDLRSVIAEKRSLLQRTESVAARGKQDPSYRRLEREIADYEQALEEALRRMRPTVRRKMETMSGLDRDRELAELRSQLATQRSIEDMLRDRYSAQLQELGLSNGSSLELEFLRAELAREERVFDLIGDRATTLRTETRAPGRVSRIREALPPEEPVQRVPFKPLALAFLVGLCLPWGAAFAWEYHARPISDADQIASRASLPVIAEISRFPMRGRPRAAALGGSSRGLGLYAESIDSLRTCLTLSEPFQGMQVFAVASAISGEGKSSISAQLAVSVARASNARSLLIDADMRSPDLHRIFQIPLAPGLSQVLDGACPWQEAIVTRWSEHLHLLPAGELRNNPHRLVGSGAFRALLKELRAEYGCVVIDTAPLLAASESLVIAKEADGVVLCAMRDRSREDQMRRAHERLLAAGVHSVGAVLSGVPAKRYARTYGSYPSTY